MKIGLPTLPGANSVPILGQPTIHGFTGPQVTITCPCAAKSIILVPGFGFASQCKECKQAWTILAANTIEGEFQIVVGAIVLPTQEGSRG